MLPSQRALFDLPREICYLNAAGWSPLPLAVQEAGRAGVARKGRPWELAPDFAAAQHERARAAAARLIGADPDDVALIPSVGYGVATAGKALGPLAAGSRVLVLEDDHSSPVLEWVTRAPAEGFAVETVRRPGDGDWAAALLEAIERPGAPPVAVASVSSVHWSDGGALALDAVAQLLRARGAALVVDATHGVGVVRTDVAALDPDFLVFPTYKWTLGPYGRAFLYVAKRRQAEGVPLEQTSHGRRGVAADRVPYLRDLSFAPGARRFDMGERDHFISLEMAAVGMEMMAGWGADAVAERLRALTDRMAEGLRGAAGGVRVAGARTRAPNLLCLEFPDGMPGGLVERLAAEGVHVAARVGRVRVSPHVYNDEEDADRFVEALRRAAR
ncbi:MAG: Cysteine desulfurase [uncultured Acetobacteraceae bacterium]|uniref:Cysteine desulfurase n=1 Tax=uncultured Acetobacteraceae bacterium TaxID=169975 RepID=A0A6J4HRP6_9PROT|nr:MAG: Cysteine desulfurase [uncultured Acetobacteraceae bacterium]